MLYTRPPRGHSSAAIATQRPATTWIAGMIALALVIVSVLTFISITTPIPTTLVSGFNGLVGAGTVLIIGTRYYACGPDWFRRGSYWVNLTELARVTVDGDSVELSDTRQDGTQWSRWMRPGRVQIPLAQLDAQSPLYAALRNGIQDAVSRRPVDITPGAAQAFQLNATTEATG